MKIKGIIEDLKFFLKIKKKEKEREKEKVTKIILKNIGTKFITNTKKLKLKI